MICHVKPALLHIRAMTADDLPGVWAIEQTIPGPWTYDQLKDELDVPHGWCFVIWLPATASTEDTTFNRTERQHVFLQPHNTSDRQPILGYIFGTTILDEAEIRKIAVADEYRRHGVATALLSAVDQFFITSAVKECFLEVRATNTAALTLYKKNGFQIVGRRKNYYTMPTDDAILVRKSLTTPAD